MLKDTLKIWLAMLAVLAIVSAGRAYAAPTCIPGFKGPTTEHPARFVNGTNGLHVFWWCPASNGTRTENGFSCGKYGGCARAVTRLLESDFNASTDALWDANVRWACTPAKALENSDDGRLCEERLAVLAANTPVWFPAPVWRVKVSGTATTRPGYALTNGVLGTRETARAPVGAVCDLTKPTAPATLGDIRAQWADGPAGVVTICSKVNL